MPKILITGNGFDLNFGLPTMYKDFMLVMNEIEISQSTTDIKVTELLLNTSVSKDINNTDEIIDLNHIQKLKQKLSTNLWYQYFKKELNINTWIDFENRIEFALNHLIKFGNYIDEELKLNNLGKHVFINLDKVDSLDFKIAEQFALIKNVGGREAVENQFILSRESLNIQFNYDNLGDYLYSDLNLFINIFTEYFQIFILPLIENFNNSYNIFGGIIMNYTFNYTPTFDKVNKVSFTQVQSRFLHGVIKEDNQNIVLGVDKFIDEDKEYLKSFLKFKKTNQVFQKDTDKFDIENTLDSYGQYEIIFFGHSMDKSDLYYINKIFDLVSNQEPNQMGLQNVIIIYCHNNESRINIISNLQTMRSDLELQKLREMNRLKITTNLDDLGITNNSSFLI